MAKYELKDYQIEAVSCVVNDLKDKFNPLLIMATGTGKTIVASHIIKELQNKRILFIAHREELINQAKNKIYEITEEPIGIEQAETYSSGQRIIIASIQSISRDSRLNKLGKFDLIITDECHRSFAPTYKKVYDYFNCQNLGLTATPYRSDNNNIGVLYNKISFNYSLKEAIEQKNLANIEGLKIESKIDISKCKVSNGDFLDSELSAVIQQEMFKIVNAISTNCNDKKTIIFMPLVKDCLALERELNNIGFPCKALDGTSKNRSYVINDFKDGKIKAIINCRLFTEGFDEPSIDCVVIARPTKSKGLYSQMVGRGTRLYPGKSNLLLILFNWYGHNLVQPFELFITNKFNSKIREKANEKFDKEGRLDILETLNQTYDDIYQVKEMLNNIKYGQENFNPLGFMEITGLADNEMDVYFKPEGVDRTFKITNVPGTITEPQMNLLIKKGFNKQQLKELSRAQASKIIDLLAQNGWNAKRILNNIKGV